MKLLIEFLKKPLKTKLLLFSAMFYSLYYKLTIKNTAFSGYAEKMGEFQYETPQETIDDPRIQDVKWIAYAIRRWTPWKCLCFDQALMSKKLLNRMGLPCTLYMGVCKDEKGALLAHAWLRCGTVLVSGGRISEGYAVTGIYGDRIVPGK